MTVPGWLSRLLPTRSEDASPGLRQSAFFVRRLQLLLSASIGLIPALETLEKQEEDARTSLAIRSAIVRVERGRPLSSALGGKPRLLSAQCEEIVKMAESNGQLDIALRQLADTLEKTAGVAQRLSSALIVPAFQVTGSLLLLALLVVLLLPGMLELANGLGADIGPLPRALFSLASLALDPLVILAEVQVVLASVFALRRWRQTPEGRLWMDQQLLSLPLLGALLRDVAAFRFAQDMGLMLNCGSTPMSALKSVGESLGNAALREQLEEVGHRVYAGETLAQALRASTCFDPMLISVVAVGEETGRLPSMLSRLAPFFQERVEQRLEAALDIFEPLVLGIVGLVVGVLSLMFFHPLMRIVEKL